MSESKDNKDYDETNYNPDAFSEETKRYEEEEKILSQMKFKSPDDQFVFDRLPILPNQKLMMVYQLIAEDDTSIECDEELKDKVVKILKQREVVIG